MPGIDRHESAEAEYADHLERSRTVWDRWSNWYTLSERDFAPMRESLLDALDLTPDDRVLDVGCGPGVNLAGIRERVGPTGEVQAFDFSPEMVDRARQRVATHGWENVSIHRADATTSHLGGPYDAVVATLSLSVMPDVDAAVRNVHGVMAPGAALGVLDIRPFPGGFRRICNPLLRRFLRWYANWNPAGDVEAAVREAFEETARPETHMLGAVYTMIARRA